MTTIFFGWITKLFARHYTCLKNFWFYYPSHRSSSLLLARCRSRFNKHSDYPAGNCRPDCRGSSEILSHLSPIAEKNQKIRYGYDKTVRRKRARRNINQGVRQLTFSASCHSILKSLTKPRKFLLIKFWNPVRESLAGGRLVVVVVIVTLTPATLLGMLLWSFDDTTVVASVATNEPLVTGGRVLVSGSKFSLMMLPICWIADRVSLKVWNAGENV